MDLPIPVIWTDRHRDHQPGAEIWVGVRTPGTELPERAERIREALLGAGASFVEPSAHPGDCLLRVHDAALLGYLGSAWENWQAAGLTEDPGQDRVVPYIFPHPGLFAGLTPAIAAAPSARAGQFAFDTMTLIGPGTWDAARAAADAALSAADLVADGTRVAYACTRPPGHHVTRSCFGGSCYLNNAAIAAAHLRDLRGGRVAIIDIDAHHGNGAQEIFYEDPEVLTASIHVDPGQGWFPHFLGFAGEDGAGAAVGANRNMPLAPGTGDEPWLEAVSAAGEWAREAGAGSLVVALGVDAAGGDPESPLEVTADGYRAAGRVLANLGLPTVIVQEGGYRLATVGELVLATLTGFSEGL